VADQQDARNKKRSYVTAIETKLLALYGVELRREPFFPKGFAMGFAQWFAYRFVSRLAHAGSLIL
jgi:hypothetical protein